MVTALVLLTLATIASSSAAWITHRRSIVPIERRTVLINFVHSGNPSVRGVLFSRRAGFLVLKSVSLVERDGSVVPVDGDVVVELGQVLFLQVLPHT